MPAEVGHWLDELGELGVKCKAASLDTLHLGVGVAIYARNQVSI